jgi:hypothetical protein
MGAQADNVPKAQMAQQQEGKARSQLYGAQAQAEQARAQTIGPESQAQIGLQNSQAGLTRSQNQSLQTNDLAPAPDAMRWMGYINHMSTLTGGVPTPTPPPAPSQPSSSQFDGAYGPHSVDDDGQPMHFRKGTSRVPGKGSGMVDSVKARLAPGEAVLNRAAADAVGRGVIAAQNAAGAARMGMVPPTQAPAGPPGYKRGTANVGAKKPAVSMNPVALTNYLRMISSMGKQQPGRGPGLGMLTPGAAPPAGGMFPGVGLPR